MSIPGMDWTGAIFAYNGWRHKAISKGGDETRTLRVVPPILTVRTREDAADRRSRPSSETLRTSSSTKKRNAHVAPDLAVICTRRIPSHTEGSG